MVHNYRPQPVSTVVVELRIFRRLEKQMQYFIVILLTGMPGAFYYWWYKTSNGMNNSGCELPKNMS